MTGWAEFIAAFITFFLSHSIPVRPTVKARLKTRLGAAGFGVGYSLLSIAVLAWLIVAANRAPFVPLWDWAPWQNHVTLLGMTLAVIIAALAVGRPNPLSFGGAQNDQFDPANPGIIGWMRHPLLVALMLWALSHILPNGNLAHVILFGVFAGFAALGMRIIDRRKQRLLGHQVWAQLATPNRQAQPSRAGMSRVAVGLLIYLGLIALHGPVIGVSPLGAPL